MRTQAASVIDTIVSWPGASAYACLAAISIGEVTIGRSSLAVGAVIGALWAVSLAAQEPLRIKVAPTVIATADSTIPLPIEIVPPGALPPRSFLSLRGLPRTVAL